MPFKKVGLALLFFFSGTANSDIGKKVEQLNPTVQSVGQPDKDCTDCSVTSAGTEDFTGLMQKCVESLCPNPELSVSHTVNNVYSKAFGHTKFEKEIMPLINEAIKIDAEADVARGKILSEWSQSAPPLKHSGGIRTFNLLRSLDDIDSLALEAQGNRWVVNEKESRSKLPQLSEKDFQRKVIVMNKYLELYKNRSISETDPARLRILYPGERLEEHLQEVLSKNKKRAQKIASHPEFEFLSNLESFRRVISTDKFKQKFSGNEGLTEAIVELNKNELILKLYEAMIEDRELRQVLLSEPIDIRKFAEENNIAEQIKQKIRRAQNLQLSLNGSNYGAGSTCRTAFLLAQEVLPSEQELKKYKAKVPGLLKNFKSKVTPYLSQSSAREVENQVKNWFVSFPETKEQHYSGLKKAVQKSLNQAKSRKREFSRVRNSEYRDVLYSLALKSSDESNSTDVDEACEDLFPNVIPDAAYASAGGFIIGPMVIKHGSAAEGISAHELGHLLYNTLSHKPVSEKTKNWFKKSRSCLVDNHTEFSKKELTIEKRRLSLFNYSTYDSEDWADLISSVADQKDENYACLFASQHSPQDYESFSLKNHNEADSHSSHLFRLLHINYLKNGRIPTVCRQALKTKGETPQFKNCLSDSQAEETEEEK